jgi:hypothetical protein
MNAQTIRAFIQSLDLPPEEAARLMELTPPNTSVSPRNWRAKFK